MAHRRIPAFFLRLSQDETAATGVKLTRYDTQWHEGIVNREPGRTQTGAYAKLFEEAHQKLTGDSRDAWGEP
jgi:hypothetical protein